MCILSYKLRILHARAWIRILSSSVQLDFLRVSTANELDVSTYLQATMSCSIYYINTNKIPNHFTLIFCWLQKGAIYLVAAIATVIFYVWTYHVFAQSLPGISSVFIWYKRYLIIIILTVSKPSRTLRGIVVSPPLIHSSKDICPSASSSSSTNMSCNIYNTQ